jgi:hypothetical protein
VKEVPPGHSEGQNMSWKSNVDMVNLEERRMCSTDLFLTIWGILHGTSDCCFTIVVSCDHF